MKYIIDLPKEKTLEGAANINQLIWLIYGSPGIGKSTFFSKFDRALFLNSDPGLGFIKAYKMPISTWLEFKKTVDFLFEKRPSKYNLFVIDTIDMIFTMCVDYICRKRGIEHQSDESWGKGYELVQREFKIPFQKLTSMKRFGFGTAFISHAMEVEIRGRAIRTSKTIPTLQKQARSFIMPLCDIIGYCGFAQNRADKLEGNRLIFFNPDETIEAKDRTGLLPVKCKLDFETVKSYLKNEKIKVKKIKLKNKEK